MQSKYLYIPLVLNDLMILPQDDKGSDPMICDCLFCRLGDQFHRIAQKTFIREGKHVYAAHWMIEQAIGRALIPRREKVYHRDGNRANFCIKNLEMREFPVWDHNKLSQEKITQIYKLHDDGKNYSQISRELGIADQTARQYILNHSQEFQQTMPDRAQAPHNGLPVPGS